MDNHKLRTRTRQGTYIIECRRVADVTEGLADEHKILRAMDQMEDLTSQETMLLTVVAKEGANAYRRCMEINR